MKTISTFPLIEIFARGAHGYVPVGIVNVEQALSMPDHPKLKFSHPHGDAADTGVYIDRDQLREVVTKSQVNDVEI